MRNRVITSEFEGWDAAAHRWVTLPAGTVAHNCHIGFSRRLGRESEFSPYVAEFEIDGRQYWSPLHTFQARTESLADAPAELPGGQRPDAAQG